YPPAFTPHSPWWPHYHVLGDYFGRLSVALSAGEQVNRILVLEPTSSTWLYASVGTPTPRLRELGAQFQEFVTKLEYQQVEYDLGCERIIRDHGSVKDGKFVIEPRSPHRQSH
ncbi:MAG: hypothetical protein MUC42_11700, partial [Bryobacter sp.]|nr:hypothetical protein [Bryobacter sp.]